MKKGFTLIELLMVIVVISLISLIVVPLILNVVEQARIGSEKADVETIYNGVELYLFMNGNSKIDFQNGSIMSQLGIKGKKPEKGSVVILEDGKDFSIMIDYGNNCYIKNNNSSAVEKVDKELCNIPVYYTSFEDIASNIEEEVSESDYADKTNEVKGYKDTKIVNSSSDNKKIYQGIDPANYLIFGKACFRIISYGEEGIKIIYDGSGEASTTNPCAHIYDGSVGLQANKGFIYESEYGTNSNWFTSTVKNNFESILNSTTIESNDILSLGNSSYGVINIGEKEKKVLKQGLFYAGELSEVSVMETGTIDLIENEEKSLRYDNSSSEYKGYIGLLSVSEYLKASSSLGCITYAPYGPGIESGNPCNENNYLYETSAYWSMIGKRENNSNTSYYYPFFSYFYYSTMSFKIKPVFVLKEDTRFYGNGTYFNPYRLTNKI